MQALLGGLTWRRSSLVLMDHFLILAAVVLAVAVRMGPTHELLGWPLIWRAILIAGVLQVCLHYRDLYDPRRLHDRRRLMVGLFEALGAGCALLAVIYYWLPGLVVGRGIFLVGALFIVLFVAGWRIAFEWLSSRMGPHERVLIVGTSAASTELAREIYDRRHQLGVEFTGFVEVPGAEPHDPALDGIILGNTHDIPAIVRDRGVDRVVVSLADARGKISMDELLHMKLNDGVRFDHLASVYAEYTGKIAVENLRPSWFVFSEGFRKGRLLNLAKRALDVAVSAVSLFILSPVMALVALGIRLTSPGAVFYHQARVGMNGRVFTVHKFRSMRDDAESGTGAVWSRAGDPRVTPFGRFLRRTRLDEIPQFWNILAGDMSIVGPRPERPEFVEELKGEIPFYGQRHVVRPGLTGWAQVRHSYGSSVEDSLQKLQFDLYYIKNLSIAFDLFIMLETIKTVLVRRGS
ncbi:MAG: TIGR03013 family XrtA/PEP-CTERM system glycosyltransferase [Vicinamibacteria bacterium]